MGNSVYLHFLIDVVSILVYGIASKLHLKNNRVLCAKICSIQHPKPKFSCTNLELLPHRNHQLHIPSCNLTRCELTHWQTGYHSGLLFL